MDEVLFIACVLLSFLMLKNCRDTPVGDWGCNAPPVDIRQEPFQYK